MGAGARLPDGRSQLCLRPVGAGEEDGIGPAAAERLVPIGGVCWERPSHGRRPTLPLRLPDSRFCLNGNKTCDLPAPPTMLRTELGFCRVRQLLVPKSGKPDLGVPPPRSRLCKNAATKSNRRIFLRLLVLVDFLGAEIRTPRAQ